MTSSQRARQETTIHWLRTFDVRSPLVHVADTSGPIVLAVTSFDVEQWRFKIEAGVQLKEVIFVGGMLPKFQGLPAGIPIRTHLPKDVPPTDRNVERQPRYQESVIRRMAEGELIEVDLNRLRRQSIVAIGQVDGDWVVKTALAPLNTLIGSANRLVNTQELPERASESCTLRT